MSSQKDCKGWKALNQGLFGASEQQISHTQCASAKDANREGAEGPAGACDTRRNTIIDDIV